MATKNESMNDESKPPALEPIVIGEPCVVCIDANHPEECIHKVDSNVSWKGVEKMACLEKIYSATGIENACTSCVSETTTTTTTTSCRKIHAIGILAETKNPWERRAPLTPKHVVELVKSGIPVFVQTSTTRVFEDDQYKMAGATIVSDLYSPKYGVDVVLGVKQIPAARVPKDGVPRTYCFFSHTFKGQKWNQGRFAAYADAKMTLIDYELIMEHPSSEVRAMKFGPFAGLGGAIDGLHALGPLFLNRGYATPFLNIAPAWHYRNVAEAVDAIKRVGDEIAQKGLPKAICPITFVFTSNGDASNGAQSIFKHLPCKFVSPDELRNEVLGNAIETHRLVVSVAVYEHFVERVDGKTFDKKAYKSATKEEIENEYRPIFAERYAPYVSVIVNCMFWNKKYPRIITAKDAVYKCNRLLLDIDVTCDPCGSIEFFVSDNPISKPFYTVRILDFAVEIRDAKRKGEDVTEHCWKSVYPGFPTLEDEDTKTILVYGVDHIPAETPMDSSVFFGDHLLPYVKNYLAYHDPTAAFPFADLPEHVNMAVELVRGELTPLFSGSGKPDCDLRTYLVNGHSKEWTTKNALDKC